MRCNSRGLAHDVISFNAAISARGQGGQWQRVAPLFDEMQQPGPVARCDQLQRSHLSLREGLATA
eukprot:11017712-Karenia_brevis.AAC.1